MLLWDDGRSGVAGCAAGNIVLADLERRGEQVQKIKGTVFESQRQIHIGRVCASDSYLHNGVLHWANISWDQHREMHSEAAARGKALVYLFITATEEPSAVHYWSVPGSALDEVLAKRGKNHRGMTCAIHVINSGGRHHLGGIDVTNHHHSLALSGQQTEKLTHAFQRDRQKGKKGRYAGAPQPSIKQHGENTVSVTNAKAFNIPLASGRTATLNVPIPIAESDVARLKGWLDLMGDILTAPMA